MRPSILVALVAVACLANPPKGTQIGAIREPDPDPAPPSDLVELDLRAAVDEALSLAGSVTTASAFVGHLAVLERAPRSCPAVWAGPLPPDLVELGIGEEEDGLSWLDDCVADPAGTTYQGFAYWTTELAEDLASRTLMADATVADRDGSVLWRFDGQATDSLDRRSGAYASSFAGVLSGSLTGLGAGLRAQNNTASENGGFVAQWGPDGSLRLSGSVEAFDGFGPPDGRDGSEPELASIPGWRAGMPRFTSVRFDLTFGPDCAEEPVGYVGLRGNEGFWFDVYFLPIYAVDENTAQSNAFPFEQIENQACDGVGTVFSRNVDLGAVEVAHEGWSAEIAPDFASARAGLPVPSVESYIYTLRHLPEE